LIINLDTAAAGMEIIQDIRHPDEGLLVASPAILTDHLLEVLKKYHIQRIHIKDIPAASPNPAAQAAISTPVITITIMPDVMRATMQIEPRGQAEEILTEADIIEALAAKSIMAGIDHSLIAVAVKAWKIEKRSYQYKNIAKGTPPQPGHEGGLQFAVKHLSDVKELEKVKAATHHWQLIPEKLPLQRVCKGALIARKTVGKKPTPGENILGRVIETNEYIHLAIGCGDNVEARTKDTEFYALAEGIVWWIDGKIGLTPLSFDGTAEIIVAPDSMKADLLLHPAFEGGSPPGYDAIWDLFKQNNILWGIDRDIINRLIKQAAEGVYPPEPITIAKGKPPISGENGRIELLFSNQTTLKPKANSDGSVDFRDVELIQPISIGKALARLVPPTMGTPGKDITGRDLTCSNGTAAVLPIGQNTSVSTTDPEILVAAVDGNVRYNGKTIDVNEGFIIKGDVDFSTGNIRYDKSVAVGGDVKSGFSVDCGADLQVTGTIEDAIIHVGASVLCKHGFIGHNKGLVEAKGDINISFTRNETIRCYGMVTIARESINTSIFARKGIILEGNPISAVGGLLCARDFISAKTIGNSSGSKTILDVGCDFLLAEDLTKTEEALETITKNLATLRLSTEKYEKILNVKRKLAPNDAQIYGKINEMMMKLGNEIAALENRKKIITQNMFNFEKAFITIQHSAQPGTFIRFGQRQQSIREELIGPKTIRLVDYEIKIY
jgi:uncharacterized protein (DUF342 family)